MTMWPGDEEILTEHEHVAFRELVRRMRDAQKAYFRERNKEALVASKQLEKQVDEWLKP